MNLEVLLPYGIFAKKTDVSSIVAEAIGGSFGLLPHRRDCVAPLLPGILVYSTPTEGEAYIAIDEGVLIKTGADVRVSVRRAVAGTDLGHLRGMVEKQFTVLDARTDKVRSVMAKLEAGVLRRLVSFRP